MKRNTKSLIVLAGALFTLLSCHGDAHKDFFRSLAETPAKNLKNYDFDASVPLAARVKPAPPFVLEYLRAMDKATSYSSYTPTPDELTLIEAYAAQLPRLNREALNSRVIGIYFVNNFLGSGMTDYVLDDKKNMFTILIFNPATLKNDMSTWMTIRENSCFIRNDQRVTVTVKCGNLYVGFMYALLHESSHVVDYLNQTTPYVDKDAKLLKAGNVPSATAFTRGVWKDFDTPIRKYDFPERKQATFYGLGNGPKLAITDAPKIYEQLRETPFVSLYGSQAWPEDFAEFATWYHFTQKLGQPYEITYSDGTNPPKVLRPMESSIVRERVSRIQMLY